MADLIADRHGFWSDFMEHRRAVTFTQQSIAAIHSYNFNAYNVDIK